MSLSMLQRDTDTTPMVYNSALHLQLQQHREKDRRVLYLNNRGCVLVLSKGDYSEANKLFDLALMIHKEQTEESSQAESFAVETAASLPSVPHECYEVCDTSSHSYDPDFSEGDIDEIDDFGESDMDWDAKEDDHVHTSIDSQLQLEESRNNNNSNNNISISISSNMNSNLNSAAPPTSTKILHESPPAPNRNKIPRMTSFSRLQSISYCGQQEYHEEKQQQQQQNGHHQVYSLPIVMDETEWDTAPFQDKSFVLIFNTALCNHLWGMELMQQYLDATANNNNNNGTNSVPSAAMAQHCRETLTVAKLLYKLALENSVSFANGVDKMCYVALYNNLSHVCKTLEGYDSMEAQWCDDMLLKAIFWWRDSTQQYNQQQLPPTSRNSNDMYLDDDVEIIDAFFENVYYRIGVPEDIVPAAAA